MLNTKLVTRNRNCKHLKDWLGFIKVTSFEKGKKGSKEKAVEEILEHRQDACAEWAEDAFRRSQSTKLRSCALVRFLSRFPFLFSFALRFPRCWFPLSTNENVEIPNEILKKSRSQNGHPDSHLSSTTTLREVKMRNPIPICPQWLHFEESKLCGLFLFCFPCCDIATLAIILREHLAKFGYRSHISRKSC